MNDSAADHARTVLTEHARSDSLSAFALDDVVEWIAGDDTRCTEVLEAIAKASGLVITRFAEVICRIEQPDSTAPVDVAEQDAWATGLIDAASARVNGTERLMRSTRR